MESGSKISDEPLTVSLSLLKVSQGFYGFLVNRLRTQIALERHKS